MSTISTQQDMEANPQLSDRAAPLVGHASELAEFTAEGFGRRVLFDTGRFRVILAAFEPDQEIPIHAPAVDLAVAVLEGHWRAVRRRGGVRPQGRRRGRDPGGPDTRLARPRRASGRAPRCEPAANRR
jgi:hypothetical protein